MPIHGEVDFEGLELLPIEHIILGDWCDARTCCPTNQILCTYNSCN